MRITSTSTSRTSRPASTPTCASGRPSFVTELYRADWILLSTGFVPDGALLVDEAGRVVAAGPAEEVAARPEAARARELRLEDAALVPGTVSAHSHCFQVFLRGWADHPRNFADWVQRYLYPLVERMDDDSLEAAALLCFASMARAGITTVGEFPTCTTRRETIARAKANCPDSWCAPLAA
ncbi:MAG: hypothetical protein D6731_18135 [Planctomycetota bacterium]|nr:MAG: hypothetical protein D6731_18135 [Planctomycetota bacterium]